MASTAKAKTTKKEDSPAESTEDVATAEQPEEEAETADDIENVVYHHDNAPAHSSSETDLELALMGFQRLPHPPPRSAADRGVVQVTVPPLSESEDDSAKDSDTDGKGEDSKPKKAAKEIINSDDLKNGARFEDGICRVTFPIDVHASFQFIKMFVAYVASFLDISKVGV